MEQQKVKEMFAVVFTFLVMGIIGFSIYEPEQKVTDVDDLSLAQTATVLQAAEHDVQLQDSEHQTSSHDTSAGQRVVQDNHNTQSQQNQHYEQR